MAKSMENYNNISCDIGQGKTDWHYIWWSTISVLTHPLAALHGLPHAGNINCSLHTLVPHSQICGWRESEVSHSTLVYLVLVTFVKHFPIILITLPTPIGLTSLLPLSSEIR